MTVENYECFGFEISSRCSLDTRAGGFKDEPHAFDLGNRDYLRLPRNSLVYLRWAFDRDSVDAAE